MYKQLFCLAAGIALTFFIPACKRGKAHPGWKQVRVEITGLDGNGIAEDHIREQLFLLEGVKTISFNYLEDEVIVLFDTVQVSADKIIRAIGSADNGKYKVIEHQEEAPVEKKEEAPPDQKDIGDDVDYDGQV